MNDHITVKELISADWDGEITAREKQLVDEHLKGCVQCRGYSQDLMKLSAVLGRWAQEDLSPDLEQRVRHGLKEAAMGREQKVTRPVSLFKAGVGGGGVLVVILAVLILSTQTYIKRSVQGRLKSAADDISRPFSIGDSRQVSDAGYAREQSAPVDFSQRQEPYYLSGGYAGKDVEVQEAAPAVETEPLGQSSLTRTAKRREEFKPAAYPPHPSVADEKRTVGGRVENEPVVYGADGPISAVRGGEFSGGLSAEKSDQILESKGVTDKNALLKDNAGVSGRKALAQAAAPASGFIRADDYRSNETPTDIHQEKRVYPEGGGEVLDGIGRANRLIYQDVEYPVDAPPSNAEEYARIEENPFLEARYNPLSTFSLDVDTASYSNIRRFLNQGRLPPVDAVRIEEMVNYFDYDYPEPGWNQPFSLTTQASSCPWNPRHYLVQVGIKAKVMSAKKVPPSNLVFLIDVSGSMNQPNKLPLLKDALRMLVDQLSGQERVAVVVYAGSASVVLDSTPGTEKWRIRQAIDSLNAGGSTAGGAGIEMAYEIARRNFIRGGNNRVILATDGDFNVGVSSDSELAWLIEDKRRGGIFLTILGFGNGNYKDAKMGQLADKGNGNYFYIDNLNEGRKVLVDELGSTIFTVAKDVKLQVEFNPAEVRAYRLVGYENRALAAQDFNDDAKDAGEVGAGHTVTAFYEVVPVQPAVYSPDGVDNLKYRSRPSGLFTPDELLTVKLRYKDPDGQESKLVKKAVHRKEVTDRPSADFQFGSAVAEFGLLLRNSRYRADASYERVLTRARSFQGADQYGRKAEFTGLVEKARSLDHRQDYYAPVEYPAVEYPGYDGPTGSNINFKGQ
jgi:Ca-activated chloride channel family protein